MQIYNTYQTKARSFKQKQDSLFKDLFNKYLFTIIVPLRDKRGGSGEAAAPPLVSQGHYMRK